MLKVQPRFDLLDEYSTLVPFGLGVAQNRAFQDPAVPAKAAKRATIVTFSSHREMLRKLLGALRQMVLSSYRPRSKDTHATSKHHAAV
jgi:hypothetical protein